MSTIKEEAQAYEPPQTLNIADLERVSMDMTIKDGCAKEGTPDEFKYKFIVVEGKKYRVPSPVLGGLKAIMAKLPNTKFFSVIKEGAGLTTKYQVIPMGK